MPGADGYTAWDIPMLQGGIYMNGTALSIGTSMWPMDWRPGGSAGTHFAMMDGSTLLQHQWTGGDAPLNLGRGLEIPVTFRHDNEADYWRVLEAEHVATRMFIQLWLLDMWYIPGKNEGQTTWKTSRRLPWGITGISHATHPPAVMLDGVAQTILTTGTPGDGEVVVPEAGGFGAITTSADLEGEYLVLRYPPELVVTIEGPSSANRSLNLFEYSATLREVQGSGGYTGATA